MCAKVKYIPEQSIFFVSRRGQFWRDVYLAMFTAYIDDSGTDPKQEVANATVLLIPAARVTLLGSEWNSLTKKEGFSAWHTSEAAARNPKSDFSNWDGEKFERAFSRVRGLCKKYAVQAMSFTVFKQDYDEIVPEPIRKYAGQFHYTWAIRLLLSHTEQWRHAKNVPLPLEYVFSWMGEKRKNPRRSEIEDVMGQAEEDAQAKGNPGEFSNWSFRRMEDIPGLQCVDALAWCVYQYGLSAFCQKPVREEAMIAWDDFTKHQGGTWGFDVTIKREHLKTWVDKELADGISAQKFEKWRQKKLATSPKIER